MSSEDGAILPIEAAGESVGARLRNGRNAAALSVVEVSTRLHLDTRTIELLEADDYDSLPAPTFVRGYLRGYARLLGLPPTPIVEEFDRMGFAPPALVADISDHTETRSSDVPVRIATFVIVAALVGLVIVWWQNQLGGEVFTAPPPLPGPVAVAPGPPPASVAEPPAPAPGETVSAPEAPLVPPPETSVATAGPAATGAPLASPPEATTSVEARPQRESRDPAAPADAAAEPVGVAESPAPADGSAASPSRSRAGVPAATTAAAGREGASGPTGRIEMRFVNESWVEVYDSSGRRLYYNLVKPGVGINLQGSPPFRVVLGRAKDITIEYNGQFFDYLPFVTRGIARFELGGKRGRPAGAEGSREGGVDSPTE